MCGKEHSSDQHTSTTAVDGLDLSFVKDRRLESSRQLEHTCVVIWLIAWFQSRWFLLSRLGAGLWRW